MAKKSMKIGVDKLPKQESTRIIFLLDRSTSMNSIREEAVAGFNEYLAEQQKADGDATISLIFFDSKYDPVYESLDIKKAPSIICGCMGDVGKSPYTYSPQGMTSLFDYIHDTIIKFKDTAKPNVKTIFAILTDGEDTSSKRHTYTTVQQAIKEVQDAHGWEVLFLGANMNAKNFAQSVGIKLSNVAQFDATSKGIKDAIGTMAFASSYYRGDSATLSAARSRGIGGQSVDGVLQDIDMAKTLNAVASGDVKVNKDKKDD